MCDALPGKGNHNGGVSLQVRRSHRSDPYSVIRFEEQSMSEENKPTAGAPQGAQPNGAPKDASRREFLTRLGVGSLIVAGAGTGLFAYEYMSPNVLFEAPPIVKAGKPDQFPLDSVTLDP